jgi:uncharacterized protein
MAKLTEEMKDMLSKLAPASVATASSDGMPNVVAIGSINVLDDEHLLFATIFTVKTLRNLQENPKIAVAVIDGKNYKGYQFKGTAELLNQGPIYDNVVKEIEKAPMKLPRPQYAVKIKVEEIFNLSPGS